MVLLAKAPTIYPWSDSHQNGKPNSPRETLIGQRAENLPHGLNRQPDPLLKLFLAERGTDEQLLPRSSA